MVKIFHMMAKSSNINMINNIESQLANKKYPGRTLKPLKAFTLMLNSPPNKFVVYAVQLVGIKTMYLQKLIKVGF